jgi:hypothetical protein
VGKPALSAELIHDNRRPPLGITVHADTLLEGEVVDVDGMAVTAPARTAFDIGRRTTLRLQAVQRLDALMNATDVKLGEVEAVIAQHAGARGLVRLRGYCRLSTVVPKPQETRARLVLIDAGPPRPQTQIRVLEEYGDFVARIDLGCKALRVAIEYDGAQHSTSPEQRARDIDRYAALSELGWTIVRLSSDLLRYRRGTFVARVVAAMRAAGGRP